MIAIIGAGVTGLVAASACRRAGKPFIVFEKGSDLGGVWRTLANPYSHVQVLEQVYRIQADQPLEDTPSRSSILEAARELAESDCLLSQIQFGKEVIGLDRGVDQYTLEVRDVVTEVSERVRVNHLILCPGELGAPRDFDVPGSDVFNGQLVKGFGGAFNPADAKEKNVVVVGNGAFGAEVVRECFLAGAKTIHLMGRRPPALTPKYADYFINVCPDIGSKYQRFRGVLEDASKCVSKEVFDPLDGSPDRITMKGVPTISDMMYVLLASGRLQLVHDQIQQLTPTGIITAKGKSLSTDLVICCIGFDRNLDFLRSVCHARELAAAWWIDGDPNLALLMNLGPLHFSKERMLHNTGAISSARQFMELILAGFQDRRVSDLIRKIDRVPIADALEDSNVAVDSCGQLLKVLPHSVMLRVALHGVRRRRAILDAYDEAEYLKRNKREWREWACLATGDREAIPYPIKPRLPKFYKTHLRALEILVRAASWALPIRS